MGETALKLFGAGFPLLAGYLFTRVSYYRRFKSEFMRTDHFAFYVLGYSLAFFLCGELAADLIPDWTLWGFRDIKAGAQRVGFTSAVVNSIVVSVAWAWICNVHILRKVGKLPTVSDEGKRRGRFRLAALELFVRESSDATRRLLFRASVQQTLIMVTLKSKKVYVGQPHISDFEPSAPLASIRLIPFMSGHRAENKRVVFTTFYYEIGDQITDAEVPSDEPPRERRDPLRVDMASLRVGELSVPVDIEDFGIVIPWSEVESSTIFDANIYQAFQQPRDKDQEPDSDQDPNSQVDPPMQSVQASSQPSTG